MIRWTAEAENHTRSLTDFNNAVEETNQHQRRQHQPDDHYGLHNFVVLDSLLKRVLNLQ